MPNPVKVFVVVCVIVLMTFLASCAHTHRRPPRPGKNFIWMSSHTTPAGEFIPGHWKQTGPTRKGKVWVPAHRGPDGRWVPGRWRD